MKETPEESAYDRIEFGCPCTSVLTLEIVASIDSTCENLQYNQSEAELRQRRSLRPSVAKTSDRSLRYLPYVGSLKTSEISSAYEDELRLPQKCVESFE